MNKFETIFCLFRTIHKKINTMNQSESNKFRELSNIRNFFFNSCEKEKNEFVAFGNIASDFLSRLNRIDQCNAGIGGTEPFLKGETKKIQKQKLSKTAEGVAGGVFAFANMEGNRALKNAVRYSYSDFYRPHPKTTIGRCRQVLNAARKIKKSDYPREHLLKFEEMIIDFEKLVLDYKTGRKLHGEYVKQFKKLLAETMDFLVSELDPFMKMFAFYSATASGVYFGMRGSKSPGRRKHYKKSTVSKIKIGKDVSMNTLSEKIKPVSIKEKNNSPAVPSPVRNKKAKAGLNA
jgi:hypothetical protein